MMKNGLMIAMGLIILGGLLYWGTRPAKSNPKPAAKAVASPSPAAAAVNQQENQAMTATISTSMGDIVLDLYPKEAPKTVANFKGLAEKNYFDGLIFHRVIKDFMIQGGDPTGTGTGGESIYGAKFDDEINSHKIVEGTVAMANAGPNTNGSQFYIVTTKRDVSYLDGHYTVFGQVKSGLDVAYKISQVKTGENDKPVEAVKIKDVVVAGE